MVRIKVSPFATSPRWMALLLCGTALSTCPVSATDWTGSMGTNDWFTAGNWSAGVPTNAEDAYLGIGGTTAIPVISGAVQADTADLFVGVTNTGLLFIQNGGDLVVWGASAVIGDGSGVVGSVSVNGSGSAFIVNPAISLVVGDSGVGYLFVENGAQANVGSLVAAATGTDSEGTIEVTSSGSALVVQSYASIGYEGTGSLIIDQGGVTISDELVIGEQAGSNGAVTVSGAGGLLHVNPSHNAAYSTFVGQEGTGSLTVEDGATAILGGHLVIGANVNSDGTVTVAGSGSDLDVHGDTIAGDQGTGALSVSDGAHLTSGGVLYVGSGGAGADGLVTVQGVGSQLFANNGLRVGDQGGTGVVSVSGGSEFFVQGADTTFGYDTGSNGTLSVSGPGTLFQGEQVFVGGSGYGILDVMGGATLEATSLTIGLNAGGVGVVSLTSADTNASAGAVQIGFDGTGLLNLSAGAHLDVGAGTGTIEIATSAGAVGQLVIGGGMNPDAAGTINAAQIFLGPGASSLKFNHTDTGYVFAPVINGSGDIEHWEGTTVLTGDASGFTGMTLVSGGSLLVNNDLGGTVLVSGAGTLGGSGNLGTVTIDAGGALAPGNSVGILFAVNATLNAGSTYVVELNNGGFASGVHNDVLAATGTVTINGADLHVTPENGTDTGATYLPGTYTIITAAGGVTGTFANLTDDYAFLEFALSYGANEVFLTSALTATSFCLPGMTANQCATGDGAFSIGGGPVFMAVAGLSNAEAPIALDLLSGEIHASAKTAMIEDSRFAREAAISRLAAALKASGGSTGRGAEETPGGGTLWARGFGAWSRWAGDGNVVSMDRSIGGVFVGGDVEVTDDIYLGIMGGYSRSFAGVDDRLSSAKIDSYTLGTYAGVARDALSLKSGLALSWHGLEAARSINFTGFSDSLSASYNAQTFQVFGEAAYNIDAGDIHFEPFVNLAHVRHSTDGFAETGGAAALIAAAQSIDATFATLGLRVETQLALGETSATLSGGLGWRHAFGATPTSTHAFAAGADAFTIAGTPHARDTLLLDAGVTLNLSANATFGLSYNGQLGSSVSDHGLKASFGVAF